MPDMDTDTTPEAGAARTHGFQAEVRQLLQPVSYTHLTLPTNREV